MVFLLAVTGLISGTLWYSHSGPTGTPAGAVRTGVDFSQDPAANGAASDLGQKLLAVLPSLAGYAGMQIVQYGIEVDVVGPPSAAIQAVVARDGAQYQGKPIPVRYRSVRHTEQELQAVEDRIEADQRYWQQRGIDLTASGIDINSNTVQISMAHYTKANRDALLARYGGGWVSVVPHDVVTENG